MLYLYEESFYLFTSVFTIINVIKTSCITDYSVKKRDDVAQRRRIGRHRLIYYKLQIFL